MSTGTVNKLFSIRWAWWVPDFPVFFPSSFAIPPWNKSNIEVALETVGAHISGILMVNSGWVYKLPIANRERTLRKERGICSDFFSFLPFLSLKIGLGPLYPSCSRNGIFLKAPSLAQAWEGFQSNSTIKLVTVTPRVSRLIPISEYASHYLCFMAWAGNQVVAPCCGDAAWTGNHSWGQGERTLVG